MNKEIPEEKLNIMRETNIRDNMLSSIREFYPEEADRIKKSKIDNGAIK